MEKIREVGGGGGGDYHELTCTCQRNFCCRSVSGWETSETG